MSVIIIEQRRPAVIFVAANVRAIHSHSPDQIRAETCTDGFDKNTVFNQEAFCNKLFPITIFLM